MNRIAFLGLGAMGRRMVQRLLDAGKDVVVWNRGEAAASEFVAKGATVAATPRAAAGHADIVIAMVTDDAASRAVWTDSETGALAGLGSGALAIEASTLTPTWIGELAALVAGKAASFLDAPVVGSRPQAEAGQLIYLVGGAADAVERGRDVFACTGGAVHHMGPVGAGATMKLAVNALFGIQVAALAEVTGILRRSPVELAHAMEIFGSLPVASPAMKGVIGLLAARRFDPLFPVDLVAKDFRYVVDTAQRLGTSTPLAAETLEVFGKASERGLGNQNLTAVAKLYE